MCAGPAASLFPQSPCRGRLFVAVVAGVHVEVLLYVHRNRRFIRDGVMCSFRESLQVGIFLWLVVLLFLIGVNNVCLECYYVHNVP